MISTKVLILSQNGLRHGAVWKPKGRHLFFEGSQFETSLWGVCVFFRGLPKPWLFFGFPLNPLLNGPRKRQTPAGARWILGGSKSSSASFFPWKLRHRKAARAHLLFPRIGPSRRSRAETSLACAGFHDSNRNAFQTEGLVAHHGQNSRAGGVFQTQPTTWVVFLAVSF